MLIYAEHQDLHDRWIIGQSVSYPSNLMIQRAGIDPKSVLRITQARPHRGGTSWLVILPRNSRTKDLPKWPRRRA
jgi:hypothetical protein